MKFCRACWNNEETTLKIREAAGKETVRPYFERSSLGLTDRRACFAWRFIQRDFARNKSENRHQETSTEVDNSGSELMQLATVVGQEGSDFVKRKDSANLFSSNGRELTSAPNLTSATNILSDDELNCIVSNAELTNERGDRDNRMLKLVSQIRQDHDYAPTIQKEIEVTTTGGNPENKANSSWLQQMQQKKKSKNKQRKDAYKIDQNKQQVKNIAKKLLRKAAEGEAVVATANLGVRLNMPIHKAEEEMKTRRKNGEAIDPCKFCLLPFIVRQNTHT